VDKAAFFEYLCRYISPERKALFERHVKNRTRYLAICLENIFQAQNASAVLRTADLLGVHEVHTVESRNEYRPNPDVALGAQQWIHRSAYGSSLEAMNALRAQGYKLVATSPHSEAYSPENLPIEAPMALWFGTEKDGLSREVLAQADMHLKIPMYGFTESYNISVSAAICLYTLMQRIRSSDLPWEMSEKEQQELLITWASSTVKRPDLLKEAFLKSQLS
jgi:tRNA (guanosine-2'-O-)-methyltransferase